MKYKTLRFTLVSLLMMLCGTAFAGWQKTETLTVGDVVIMAGETQSATKELTAVTTSGTTIGTATDYTGTPAGTYPLTIVAGSTEGSIAFKTTADTYLSWSSGNSLTTAESVADASSWTVAYSNGFTVTNVGTTARILQYNASNPRFACYGNSGQTKLTFWKQVEDSSVATPTFTPNGGTFVGTTSVEIACETEGATIYYSMNGQAPVAGSSPIYGRALPITETTTVKAIAVKGDDQSAVASATFTQIPSYSSFASMRSLANNDLFAYTGSAFVLANVAKAGSNTKYVYIYDGNDYALIYDQSGTKTTAAEKGKYITPGWMGKVSIYHNLFELVPDDAIAVNDDPAQPVNYPEVAIGNAVTNQVITLKNITSYTVKGDSILVYINGEDKELLEASNVLTYNQFGLEIEAAEAGKTYQIVGAIAVRDDQKQFWPIEIKEQVEETPEPDPEFYIVGTMTNWQIDPNYKMTLNEKAGEGIKEFYLTTTLSENDQIKAVSSTDGSTIKSWFPAGDEGNNYVISEAGDYTIYFRPNQDGNDDWYYKVLYAAKKAAPVEPVYIETDLTAQFPVDYEGWTGATGLVGWAAPKVTTNDGRETAACERYEGTCANLGDVFTRTLTGLTNGIYRIEVYGAAAFTSGRGFDSELVEGDETAVYLYAVANGDTVKQYIPAHVATDFNGTGIATAVLDNVEITDGTVKLGMYKEKPYTNWHVVQIKGVTAKVDAVELHTNALAAAQAALDAEENAVITGEEKTALETAIATNATVAEQTAEAYQAAVKALGDATATFTGAKAAYQALADAKTDITMIGYDARFPYASEAKKQAAAATLDLVPTNAADATAKADSIYKAYRQFAESNAMLEAVEGAQIMTDSIKNPKAEDGINNWTVVLGEGSGGNIDVKSNEPWTDGAGVAEHKYFDGGNWGANAWDVTLKQDVTLPAGKYMLTVKSRASEAVQFSLFAGNDTTGMPALGATGCLFNRGWNDTSLEFELANDSTIAIGVQGVTEEVHNWMSFSDFRLVQFPAPVEPEFFVVGTMNDWTPSDEYKMVLNEAAEGAVEYMITLALTKGDSLKVKGNNNVWYPAGGAENNYVIAADGKYTIFFRPNYDGGDDWHQKVIYVSKEEVEPIYIETDLTAQFPVDYEGWTGATGLVGWAAPKVTTNDGRETAACERYEGTCANLGDVFTRTLTGLTNGIYRIEVYGAAAFTSGRGFDSELVEGDETAVYLYAETAGVSAARGDVATTAEGNEKQVVKQYIPAHVATDFNGTGIATAVLDNVVVTDGTVKLGMYKEKPYTNWHVVQIKGVTAKVDIVELHTNALAAAQAALDAEENAVITGEEKTALETAIATNATVAEQTAEAYQAAVNALASATTTFTAAKTAYDGYAAAQAYLVDLPYANAEKKPAAAEAATNAADATAKAEALMVALRAYYESAALAENVAGAKVMTDSIKNPKAEDGINNWTVVLGEGSGGNIDVKSNEPWTDAAGVAEHKYFDGGNWGAQAWDVALEQKINLPAGKYQLTTIARASGDVDFTLYAGADSVKIAAIGAAGGMFNRGWNNAAVEFEMAEADSIVIGVRGVTSAQYNWMSFSDFRLVQIEAPAVAPTYYLVGTMNEWTPNEDYKLTLNEEASVEEYSITLDLEANAELKVVSNKNVWYPEGTDNNFKINDAGNYTIYFQPNFNADWNGYIYAKKNEPEQLVRSWDFTQWSEETVANLKADAAQPRPATGWSDIEKAADDIEGAVAPEATKDNCFWAVATPNAKGELTANGVVIKELKGLVFDAGYAQKRSLAIAVNYPSTSLGDYAGPAYLWLGGGGSKQTVPCFTIPGVKAGQYVNVEMESHKPADGRGIELYANSFASENKIGEAFKPTTKAAFSWKIEQDCDVVVWNTSGCHIYTLSVDETSAINTINANVQVEGIYNMNGQKVNKAQKGLYIINGRKVVIK